MDLMWVIIHPSYNLLLTDANIVFKSEEGVI